MKKVFYPFLGMLLVVCVVAPEAAGEPARLEKARFLDKCKGAWAGQMLGVCYGSPYEFVSNGKPIEASCARGNPSTSPRDCSRMTATSR